MSAADWSLPAEEDVLAKPVRAYFDDTGEEPPGTQSVAEHVVSYANPEPIR